MCRSPPRRGQVSSAPGSGPASAGVGEASGAAAADSSQAIMSARIDGGPITSAWSSRPRIQYPQGGRARHAQAEQHRPVGPPLDDRPLPHLLDDPGRLDRVDDHHHLRLVALPAPPGIVGDRRDRVEPLGQLARAGPAGYREALDTVDTEGARRVAAPVPPGQVPVAAPEGEPAGRNPSTLTPVREGDLGVGADCVEERDQRRRRHQGGHRLHLADPGRPQLQQGMSTTRIAEMDAGDGEVQRHLLIGQEAEVGQVEGLGVDAVAELLLAADRLGGHRDPLLAEQPLVALKRLAAGVVGGRVAGDLTGDLVEGQRAPGVEEHQNQVGQALQAVGLGHRRQRRAPVKP